MGNFLWLFTVSLGQSTEWKVPNSLFGREGENMVLTMKLACELNPQLSLTEDPGGENKPTRNSSLFVPTNRSSCVNDVFFWETQRGNKASLKMFRRRRFLLSRCDWSGVSLVFDSYYYLSFAATSSVWDRGRGLARVPLARSVGAKLNVYRQTHIRICTCESGESFQ